MKVHVDKKGIRALGIAESFRKGMSRRSVLGGVVMRSDMIVDGFVFGSATVEGDDATESVIHMYEALQRNDINVMLLGGAVISLFNIIDIDRVGEATKTPIICVTFEESEGLEPHLKRHFPLSWRKKVRAYRRLGSREKISLHTGKEIYVRSYGLTSEEAKRILDKFTVQGALPEPIRLAKLAAKAKMEVEFSSR